MPRVSLKGCCKNGKHCQDSNCRRKHTCPWGKDCNHRIDDKCTFEHDPVDPANIPPCVHGDRCKHRSDGKCGNGSHIPEALPLTLEETSEGASSDQQAIDGDAIDDGVIHMSHPHAVSPQPFFYPPQHYPPQQMMMVNMAPQLAWPHPPFFPQQPCVPQSHDGPMVLPNGLHVWHARG